DRTRAVVRAAGQVGCRAAMTNPPGPADWRVPLTRRITWMVGFLAFWVAAIETRLVYLQVFARADLVARAERQQERTQPSPAKRGDILDRRGRVLATSVDADTVYAVPTEIDHPSEVATKLCEAVGGCEGRDSKALAGRLEPRKVVACV